MAAIISPVEKTGGSADTGDTDRRRILPPWLIATLAVLGGCAVYSLHHPLTDVDVWWQLLTGRIIVEQGIPRTDLFSFTVGGTPWVVHQWGAEVIVHWIRSAFGLRGIIIWRGLMVVAVYTILARLMYRQGLRGFALPVLLALAALAGSLHWTERPHLFSYLLFLMTLGLLYRRDRTVWWCVPIVAIWANLHALVLLGLGAILVVAVSEWTQIGLRLPNSDRSWARRVTLVGLTATAATLINPYGPRLLTYAFGLVGDVSGDLTEWLSPDFQQPVATLFVALLLLTIAVLALSPERPDLTDVALVGAFTFLALYAWRNLAPAAMVLALVSARYAMGAIDVLLEARRRSRPQPRPVSGNVDRMTGLGLLTLIALGTFALGALGVPRSDDLGSVAGPVFPTDIMEDLGTVGEVRLVSRDQWAGMALYTGWPDVTVALDLRAELYGQERRDRHRSLFAGDDEPLEWLGDNCVTHVLSFAEDGITDVLDDASGWSVAMREPVAGGTAVLYQAQQVDPDDCT